MISPVVGGRLVGPRAWARVGGEGRGLGRREQPGGGEGLGRAAGGAHGRADRGAAGGAGLAEHSCSPPGQDYWILDNSTKNLEKIGHLNLFDFPH